MKKIIGLFNAYSHGKSGGDEIFLWTLKKLPFKKIIITSLLGKKLCQAEKITKASYFLTSKEKNFSLNKIIFIYLNRIFKFFFSKIEVQKGDLILASSDFLTDTLPAFILKKRNSETFWLQKIFHLIPQKRVIPFICQRLSFKLIKNSADRIETTSHLFKKKLIKLGFNSKKIFVVYPQIEIKLSKSIKNNRQSSSDFYDCTFLGQLRPSKGIKELVEIWYLVNQELPSASLAVIGQGERETIRFLKQKISRLGLEKNFFLLGYLSSRKAFSLIKNSRLFVFPSFEEGFALAPLQAQTLGIPVIAWNLPIYQEIFPQGMIKIKLNDKFLFAQKIVKLLTQDKYRQKLARQALINSKRFTYEKTKLNNWYSYL